MMEQRLIDANALKEDLRESYNALKKIYDRLEHNEDRAICGGQLSTFLEAILRVKEAPTVDAVPVVRCGECKYYKQNPYSKEKHMMCMCWCDWLATDTDDFCSSGERRDSDG